MDIRHKNEEITELIFTPHELRSFIRTLKYVLTELEGEYYTRTTFYESEAENIILSFTEHDNKRSTGNIIEIRHKQVFHLRQSLVELLFGIPEGDFYTTNELSKQEMNSHLDMIDSYGKKYKIWGV